MRRTTIGSLLLVALSLAACGGGGTTTEQPQASNASGDDGTGPSSAPVSAAATATDGDGGESAGGTGGDLCSVLSNDEVAEITGVEVTTATAADLQGVLSCNYNGPDGVAVAGITLATSAAGVSVGDLFEANAAEAEPVSGIGDRAVIAGDEDFPILMVLVGDRLYSLSVIADELDGAAKRSATEELARQSVDRLP
jgi:hypothetical protein